MINFDNVGGVAARSLKETLKFCPKCNAEFGDIILDCAEEVRLRINDLRGCTIIADGRLAKYSVTHNEAGGTIVTLTLQRNIGGA
jgi:hypothetical protein